ncbi:LysR family transcriptional regulator [Streptomyces parvulus]|uniref:LysR family transcriptional regulator n=1 Tax=Streptomyces parvulus TaxID=146923 RepID=UPI00381366BF
MEIRHLRCMIAVAEERHFGRAALRLNLSQAPLSTTIKQLEYELGHKLFERTTRSVALTPIGAEFYRRAAGILAEVEETVAALDRIARGLAGTLRVGYVSSASYSILPHAVRHFREQSPDVDLRLVPTRTAEQVDLLREEKLDMGIVRGDLGAVDLESRVIFEEELVVCLPVGHALAKRATVSAGDLLDEPLISFPARDMSGFVAEFRQVFAGQRFPRVHTYVGHQETALGFVAAGEGFTLLPESVSAFMPPAVHVARLDTTTRTTVRVVVSPAAPAAAAIFEEALMHSAARRESTRAGNR